MASGTEESQTRSVLLLSLSPRLKIPRQCKDVEREKEKRVELRKSGFAVSHQFSDISKSFKHVELHLVKADRGAPVSPLRPVWNYQRLTFGAVNGTIPFSW